MKIIRLKKEADVDNSLSPNASRVTITITRKDFTDQFGDRYPDWILEKAFDLTHGFISPGIEQEFIVKGLLAFVKEAEYEMVRQEPQERWEQ